MRLLPALSLMLAIITLVFLSKPASAQTIYNCNSCIDCTSKIASASSGDTVQMTANITGSIATNCIAFNGKDNITFDCNGWWIDGTDTGGTNGIILNATYGGGSFNVTIKNCVLSDWGSGIRCDSSSNNTYQNITGMSSNNFMYFSGNSNYSNIINVSTSGDANAAFWLGPINYNNFTNVVVRNSGSRAWNFFGVGNIFTNVTGMSLNAANPGIIIEAWNANASYNSFINCTFAYNTVGVSMISFGTGSVAYNTFTGCNISRNTQSGISMTNLSSYALIRYNTFYNNYLNNTLNLNSTEANNMNYWNITKTTGTNIIGGPYIAGNYWTDLDGSNFSDLCTDSDKDGICDNNYAAATNNTDYLPLAKGVYACTSCSDCNSKIAAASSGDTIKLFADLTTSSYCIDLQGKDNITLDCNGKKITGPNSGTDSYTGINSTVADGANNTIIKNCANISYFTHGIYIRYTNNITIQNTSLFLNTLVTGYALYLDSTQNSTISNINSSQNNYAIFFSSSSSNILTNITANYNYNGIYLIYSSSNILTNITANSNSLGLGFTLLSSSSNTFTNITANYNSYGFNFLLSSSSNTLTNITANYNSMYGLYLQSCSNNNLTSITANSNFNTGFYLSSTSNYNTINNSRIENNTNYGINLNAMATNYPRYNIFYNNYLNNTVNLYSNDANNLNYWNTTRSCSSGPNIIGGRCIGGNYWTDIDGFNFSDTCTDIDGDGLCENSYTPATNNIDYLPLSPIIYNCSSCPDCTQKIASASSGDTVQLITSILNYNSANPACIFFGGKDNVTFDCLGNTIGGNRSVNTYGIWLNSSYGGSYNVTIQNCTITDWARGITSTSSPNNTYRNIIATSNGYGMDWSSSNYSIFISVNSSYNDRGFYIGTASSYNTFTNCTGSYSTGYCGFCLAVNVNYNYIANSVFNYNAQNAIVFEQSMNNTLTNCTISNNLQTGLNMLQYSTTGTTYYNTINDSRIESNTNRGIYLNSMSGYYPRYNTFYNNYLNNTVNVYSNNDNNLNYWNTTKKAGMSIVGGPWIGGNYWTNPSKTGFSDTCYDHDFNWICDTPYIPATNNTDFYPLAFPSIIKFYFQTIHLEVGKGYDAKMHIFNPYPDFANVTIWIEGNYPARFENLSGTNLSADMRNVTMQLNPYEERVLRVSIMSADPSATGYSVNIHSMITAAPGRLDTKGINVLIDAVPTFPGPDALSMALLVALSTVTYFGLRKGMSIRKK